MQPFNSWEEIATLAHSFEDCTLAPDNFRHREHLAVALWYCRQGDEDYSAAQMRQSLLRFTAHHGLSGVYHETITLFWLKRVQETCAQAAPDGGNPLALANEILRRNSDSRLINRYYTPALLNSPTARAVWQAPDIAKC